MITKFKKRKKSSFSESVVFPIISGIVVFLLIGFLVFEDIKINRRKSALFGQIDSLQKEIQDLGAKNASLESNISQVGDTDYLERVAREELNLKKEGENVVGYILPEEKPKQEENKNFWNPKTWWEWLKGKF